METFMKLAVTDHAVDRYLDRVEGAKGFERTSVREVISQLVEDGFAEGAVRPHPAEPQKRIIPFKSGDSILYLSIGPNLTEHEGDLAVINVLFEKELGGKKSIGVTLGDVANVRSGVVVKVRPPRFKVFIGAADSIESYSPRDETELVGLLQRRQPKPEDVFVYEIQPTWRWVKD